MKKYSCKYIKCISEEKYIHTFSKSANATGREERGLSSSPNVGEDGGREARE